VTQRPSSAPQAPPLLLLILLGAGPEPWALPALPPVLPPPPPPPRCSHTTGRHGAQRAPQQACSCSTWSHCGQSAGHGHRPLNILSLLLACPIRRACQADAVRLLVRMLPRLGLTCAASPRCLPKRWLLLHAHALGCTPNKTLFARTRTELQPKGDQGQHAPASKWPGQLSDKSSSRVSRPARVLAAGIVTLTCRSPGSGSTCGRCRRRLKRPSANVVDIL
jgi:hypothetical protein